MSEYEWVNPWGELRSRAMQSQGKQVPDRRVPIHRWLFGFAVGLTIIAVPYAAVVYTEQLPTALVNLNMITAAGLWIFAELRRQRWERVRIQEDLTELVAAVERR
jgi:hypothetical protein